ncbi:Protein kinase domain-containing protein [Mycena kentingensis (nom. inval.)]|nr:Protein kinase domain-containing protein [Mycena kentingensis (nom. inval.)]
MPRSPPSPTSSASSFEDDEDDDDSVNARLSPCWDDHRALLNCHGYLLDTVEEVRQFYLSWGRIPDYFLRKHAGDRNDALCPDPGLRDNLFRGRACDGTRVVIKAVHSLSRELAVIRFLSTPPCRDDPRNHCIPVLDLIEAADISFVVMEQWSSQLIDDDGPCCLRLFLAAIRQCIEHIAFMHLHRIAHLDISLRNLLTDYKGNYAVIDYELSRRCGPDDQVMCIRDFRSTEIPPECEHGECLDPFKADIWALAIFIIRASKLAGYSIPQLVPLTTAMLATTPQDRPTTAQVITRYDEISSSIQDLEQLPAAHRTY